MSAVFFSGKFIRVFFFVQKIGWQFLFFKTQSIFEARYFGAQITGIVNK